MSYPFGRWTGDTDDEFVCQKCFKKKPWKYARVGPSDTKYEGKSVCGLCLLEILQEKRNKELKESA